MKIDPNSPAFPRPHTEICEGSSGLPIRLHLAALNMAASFSSNADYEKWEHRAQDALAAADALIREYNRTEEKR